MEKAILTRITVIMITLLGLTNCASHSASFTSPTARQPATSGINMSLWQGNPADVWDKLQHTPPSKLAAMQSETQDPVQKAWVQLALISKRNSVNTPQLAQELITWRSQNPSHPANQLLPDNAALTQLQSLTPPQKIAVLLPQSGTYESSGQTVREGFLNSYYANLPKTGKQSIKFYDTSATQNMTTLYQQAVADGADFIIGPLVKEHVQQLSREGAFNSPTLALNYTEAGWRSLPTNFYEFGLLPEDEVSQIADQAHAAGSSRAIIIAPQTTWGNRLVSSFSTRWKANGGNVQETWYYPANADFNKEIARLLAVNLKVDKQLMKEGSDKETLEKQRRHDFDVIFLFAQPEQARVIVPLLRYYYAADVPVYASSSVFSGKPNPAKDVDLNGVIVCDIPWTKKIVRSTSPDDIQTGRLYAVGQDAYLLSQTLQRLERLPNFPIYGTTGALTLSSSQQIHRRLPCNVLNNGHI